jgi:ribosomal protein L34E
MGDEVFTRWTCDRCGAAVEVAGKNRPDGWRRLPDRSTLTTYPADAYDDVCERCDVEFDQWWAEGRVAAEPRCEFCGEPITMVDVGTMDTGPGVEFMQGDCPNHCAPRRAGIPVVPS